MSVPTKETCETNGDECSSSSTKTTHTMSSKTDQDSNTNLNPSLKKSSELTNVTSSNNNETSESVIRSDQLPNDMNNIGSIEKQQPTSTPPPQYSANKSSNDFQYQPDNALCVEEFIKNQLQDHPKDRLFMLNIEKELIKFLNDDKRDNYKFQSMNPFYRMLVHRIGDYFGLGHNVDQLKQSVIVFKTEKTKIPTLNFQSIITSSNENQQPNNIQTSSSNSETSSTSITPNSSSLNLVNVAATSAATLEGQVVTLNNEIGASSKVATQTQKKQILKREVNNQDSLKNKLNAKSSSEVKTKTFEEKSADYIRIKNRIFNNNENLNEIVASPSNNNNESSEINSNNLSTTPSINHPVESKQQISILNRLSVSRENKHVNPTNNSPPNRQNLNNKNIIISSNSNNININQKHHSTYLAGQQPSKEVINSNNTASNGYSSPHLYHQYKLMQQQTTANQASVQKTQQNNFAQPTLYQTVQNSTPQQSHHLNKNETATPSNGQFYLIAPAYTQNNNINPALNGNGYNQNQLQAAANNQFLKSFAPEAHQQQVQNSIDSNSNNVQNYFTINQQQQHHFAQQPHKQQQISALPSQPGSSTAQNFTGYQVINQQPSQHLASFHNSKHLQPQPHHQITQMIPSQIAPVNSAQQVILNHNTNLNMIDSSINTPMLTNIQVNNPSYSSMNQNDRSQLYNQAINGSSINYQGLVVSNNKIPNDYSNQNRTFQSNNINSTMSGFELNSNYQSTSRYNNFNLKTMSNRETGKLDHSFNNNFNNNNNNKLQRKIHQRSTSNNNNNSNQNIISSPYRPNNNSISNINTNQSLKLPLQFQSQIQNSNSFVKIQQTLPFNNSSLSNIPGQVNTLPMGVNNQMMYSNMHNIGNIGVSNTSQGVPPRNMQPISYQQPPSQTQINMNQQHLNQTQSFISNQMNGYKQSVINPNANTNTNVNYQIQKQHGQAAHFNKSQNQSRQPQGIYQSNSFVNSNSNGNFNNNNDVNKMKQFSTNKKFSLKQQPNPVTSTQEKNDVSKTEKKSNVQDSFERESSSFEQKTNNEELSGVINSHESTILPILSSTENSQISSNEKTSNELNIENGKILNENHSKAITVQVYNLKQNLTKQMLKDLLKPHVASIDFKSKIQPNVLNLEQASNEDTNNFNSVINEENEDVFIKFDSLEKLRQTFKLFNLKEDQINGIQHKNESDDKNVNKIQNHETSTKNDSPFLLRQLTIY